MFNKLKQVKDLRAKAKKIQATLAEEVVEETTKGITIRMDGNQNIKSIQIEDHLMNDKIRLESNMTDAMNSTIKKVQKKMAVKLQKMGGLDLPGLS